MMLKLIALSTASALIGVSAQDEITEVAVEPIDLTAQVETSTEVIAETDIDALVEAEFASADVNGDDILDQSEFIAKIEAEQMAQADGMVPQPLTEPKAQMSAEADMTASSYLLAKFEEIAGDDALVSEDELKDSIASDFAQADTDGNGVVEGVEAEVFASLRLGKPAL